MRPSRSTKRVNYAELAGEGTGFDGKNQVETKLVKTKDDDGDYHEPKSKPKASKSNTKPTAGSEDEFNDDVDDGSDGDYHELSNKAKSKSKAKVKPASNTNQFTARDNAEAVLMLNDEFWREEYLNSYQQKSIVQCLAVMSPSPLIVKHLVGRTCAICQKKYVGERQAKMTRNANAAQRSATQRKSTLLTQFNSIQFNSIQFN